MARFLITMSMAVLALTGSTWAEPGSKLSTFLREENAIYLEDFLEKPIKLDVLKPAHAYSTLKGERYLGTLRSEQEVTVLAIGERAYRVRGLAQQGQIAGWVGTGYLEKLKPDFVENLKKAAERKAIVDELIANHEVALGMTMEEVEASLGEPTKQSSRVDQDGRTDMFQYITYDRVPQTSYYRGIDGRYYSHTTYVKVETGRISVEFRETAVTAISESEDNQSRRDRRILPAPIVF